MHCILSLVVQLSDKRFVSVSNFRGKILVNIREYYDDRETGERKPGKKGECIDACNGSN